jgi:hypothetical protein
MDSRLSACRCGESDRCRHGLPMRGTSFSRISRLHTLRLPLFSFCPPPVFAFERLKSPAPAAMHSRGRALFSSGRTARLRWNKYAFLIYQKSCKKKSGFCKAIRLGLRYNETAEKVGSSRQNALRKACDTGKARLFSLFPGLYKPYLAAIASHILREVV